MSFEISLTRRLGDGDIALDFQSATGLTALFGPSGSGKTSVLHTIAGLLRPDAGRIVVNGVSLFDSQQGIDIPPEQRRAGYVFQDGRLFPHQRVRENLLYGQRFAATERRWMSLEETVEFLGIGHLLARWPSTLSGGEKQRVAIGRALLSAPAFLLMDEPLSSLDRARREDVMQVIERIRDQLRLPILYVSHDASEVERLANAVIHMESALLGEAAMVTSS